MSYKVPFVNPQKHYQEHRKEYLALVDDVFSRGDLIMRRDLEDFEKNFAKFVGVKYAVGVNAGTSALDVAFQAAGIGAGDEVITVGHTFIASISCVYLTGAKPVLIDVGRDFNMDATLIEKAITKRTKVIEPVHLNGRLCDMEAIMAIAKKYNLLVIEDAAQALGASLKMKNGSVKKAGSFGFAGCFSLYPFKILGAFGNGGIITTDNAKVAQKLRLMRYNGEDRVRRKFYYHAHNFLLDNVQAALLNLKLQYLPTWLKRREDIAKLYYKGLAKVSDIKLPHFDDTRFSDVYTNYVIRAKRRDELKQHLEKNGIETLISWPSPIYREPAFGRNALKLSETEKICKEVLSLPMHPYLTNSDVAYVIKIIREFYR